MAVRLFNEEFMSEEQKQEATQQNPILTLELSVNEVNQVIAGLENFTKPLIQKIVDQAKSQLNQ